LADLKVRERIRAVASQRHRLERTDRAAAALITLGGLGVVLSVVGILVFVLSEAWPMFRSPRGERVGQVRLAAPAPAATGAILATATPGVPEVLASGVDEYQAYVYQLRRDGRVLLFKATDGSFARELPPPPSLAGARLTTGARTPIGDFLAAGTDDGRVALLEVKFQPVFEGSVRKDVAVELVEHGAFELDPARRPIRALAYRQDEAGNRAVAAAFGTDELSVLRATDAGESRITLRAPGEVVTTVALGGPDQLLAGTASGQVHHWELFQDPPRLISISPVGGGGVTALTYVLGDTTFLAGTSRGEITAWFAVRPTEDEEPVMSLVHRFESQGALVRGLEISTRDKSFVSVGDDGSVSLHYLTNRRRLLHLTGAGGATVALITPRNDAILALSPDEVMTRFDIDVPHPEITFGSLFGKSWYEGYPRPDYVWQSTGATNDFEPKFSLVPLVFGTLKGTLYALLFAVPLAVLGALYTSQFVHPDVRARIKPTLEIMAALPSVVIGFVAGLWLASIVERWIVPVLLAMAISPVLGTCGVFLWNQMPTRMARRLKPGTELLLILPLLLLSGWLATLLGPVVEQSFFAGDFKLWLSTAAGVTYDQRNSLVVGLAMGFAVIPIIFTIADDAFTSVPANLTAGSLALGASRWQTAVRVILPTASPGVFSAVMVGFGRAVGETMIVLMATGNTPVLDWSIFNGMRTLSANVAVEIPEAPHGGTLYRVLFFSAALLFVMTFLVNTVAELVRQRLRERYRTL
jgi:phosphate transport system permease protein